jgi:UDP-galactopyranose mutase
MMKKTFVIGAGPTGLGLAYTAKNAPIVLEQLKTVGGLCRSYDRYGGVFDIGGHSFHTPHPDVWQMVTEKIGMQLYGQQRKAWIYHDNNLIPYPFQKNYDKLSNRNIIRECEADLGDKILSNTAPSLEEWIERRFGYGIAKHFMRPYNKKLWAIDLKKISTDWVTERIAPPKREDQNFSATSGRRLPLQSDTMVYYPANGGFGEIFSQIAAALRIPVRVNTRVDKIDCKKRIIYYSTGKSEKWENIVSTIPLPKLAHIITEFPKDISASFSGLKFMSLYIVYLLVKERLPSDIQRIYSAEDWFPAHKVALNHNSSEALKQRSCHALTAEVSYSKDKPVEKKNLGEDIVKGLCKMRVLNKSENVMRIWVEKIKYAYPIYTHDRLAIVQNVKEWLERNGIFTAGRFGSWEYKNSDACLKEGMDLAMNLSL